MLVRQRCIFFAGMSDDERSLSVPCGCNCQPETLHASEAENEDLWPRCDCVLCGGGRCGVRVSDCVKFAWWVIRRGRSPSSLEEIQASPRFCGSCADFHHLKLKQEAVGRARAKKRTSENRSDLDVEATRIGIEKHPRTLDGSDVKIDKADERSQ